MHLIICIIFELLEVWAWWPCHSPWFNTRLDFVKKCAFVILIYALLQYYIKINKHSYIFFVNVLFSTKFFPNLIEATFKDYRVGIWRKAFIAKAYSFLLLPLFEVDCVL